MSAAALQSDAERLAAHYGHDVDRLQYEWDRRSFGSFTTTLEGSREQRNRYRKAWEVAVAREAATPKAQP